MADFEPGQVAPDAPATDSPVVDPVQTTDAPESTADQESEATPGAPPERTFTQSDLDKIVQKEKAQAYRKAEREAQGREDRIRQEVEQRVARTQPQPTQPTGEPKPAQFQDYESYIAALTDYKVDQRMQGVRQQTEQQQRFNSQREQATQFEAKLTTAAAKYADFHDVAFSDDVPITQPMAAAIARLKDPGEAAYFLGSNTDEAQRISRLDPVDQVWEIKALEARLKSPPSLTKTPAPISPSPSAGASTKSTSDMSDSEWVKWRESDIKQKRAR